MHLTDLWGREDTHLPEGHIVAAFQKGNLWGHWAGTLLRVSFV